MEWSKKWAPRIREILPAGIMVLAGVAVASAVLWYQLGNMAIKQADDRFGATAEEAAARVSAELAGHMNEIDSLSAGEAVKQLALAAEGGQTDPAAISEFLKIVAKKTKAYKTVMLLGQQGEVLAASDPKLMETPGLAGNPFLEKALGGSRVISKVILDGKYPVFYILQPVYKERNNRGKAEEAPGNVAAVLAVAVDMKTIINKFIKPLRIGDSGNVFMVNGDGLVVASTSSSAILSTDISRQEYGQALLHQHSGLLGYEVDGVEKTAAIQPVSEVGWLLVCELDSAEHYARVRLIRAIVLGAGLVLAVFLFLSVWYFINQRAAIEFMAAFHRGLIFSEKVALIILLFTMIFMQFGQVIARNIFQTGVMWVDEVLRIEVLWVAFLGAGLAAEYNRHIKIDVLSHIFGGGRTSKVLDTCAQLFAMAACSLLFGAACVYIMSEAKYPAYTVVDTDFLKIPDHVFRLVIPYFFFVMSIRCVINIRRIFLGTHTRSVEP